MESNVFSIIRKIAKSNKWQTIFAYAKELNIKMFENESDLTNLQLTFLKYLNFYNSIYTDVALGEVDEDVLKDEIFEDSYILYRNKNIGKTRRQDKSINTKDTPLKTTQWRFKNRSK
jgi:hypothetical protein